MIFFVSTRCSVHKYKHPNIFKPPSAVTQTVTPSQTTHVQTQSQVAPAASPSPSVTLSTPGKVTGQSDSESNAVVIEQSPDKVGAQMVFWQDCS